MLFPAYKPGEALFMHPVRFVVAMACLPAVAGARPAVAATSHARIRAQIDAVMGSWPWMPLPQPTARIWGSSSCCGSSSDSRVPVEPPYAERTYGGLEGV